MADGAHPAVHDASRDVAVPVPSVADSLGMKLLPFVLSITAGSVDVIGFLGLGGLFIAHITGNLVILAAKLVAGDQVPVAHLISVPVFIVVLALTRLLVACLERIRIASLLPLLLLQFLLLSAFFALGLAVGPRIDPNTASMILAGMLGVAAMAVQNALVRSSLPGAPSTAVMTTNVTVFTMDVGEILLGRNPDGVAKARDRAKRTWPAIAGFLLGCALGASCQSAYGPRSLVLPAGFALVALALGVATNLRRPTGEISPMSQNAYVRVGEPDHRRPGGLPMKVSGPRASDRYNALARTFHWVIALLIAGMFLTDWMRGAAEQGSPERAWWLSAHTSLGLLVLVLSLGRLAWHFYCPPPAIHGTRIVQLAAKAGHAVLYFCTIGLPLSGLMRAMAGGGDVVFFGLTIPSWTGRDDALLALARVAHGELVMNLLLALIAGHALAALWHQFLLHDDTLRRMV